jgi:hypothetical protein
VQLLSVLALHEGGLDAVHLDRERSVRRHGAWGLASR